VRGGRRRLVRDDDGAQARRRIGPAAYIRPGLGVAGGNLERDLVTLRRLGAAHDLETVYLDALQVAKRQSLSTGCIASSASACWSMGPRRQSAIWGLTYKKDTRSTKNSPALRLLAEIDPRLTLKAWDPAVGWTRCARLGSMFR